MLPNLPANSRVRFHFLPFQVGLDAKDHPKYILRFTAEPRGPAVHVLLAVAQAFRILYLL